MYKNSVTFLHGARYKGAGKSTIIKRLEQTIGFTMFSGQSLQTEYRLLTSVAHTSHPVGWEELSARRQDTIDKAVAMLQECYQYTITRRGSEHVEYLVSAPVLLAGEDVPVQSLLGKVIRSDLSNKKGDLLPDNLSVFPVLEWLLFITKLNKKAVKEAYQKCLNFCMNKSSADEKDDGASRMVGNYAAILLAWKLICEFAEIPVNQGEFTHDLIAEMNSHIRESDKEREPWVWILEIILGEIDAGNYKYPYMFEKSPDGRDDILFIRFTHAMQHLSQTPALRAKFDAMPVKSPTILHKQIKQAGIVPENFADKERRIGLKRVAHMHGLSVNKMAEYSLSVSIQDQL